jgi:transposase
MTSRDRSWQAVSEVHRDVRNPAHRRNHAMKNESREKKTYTAPELIVHGTVEEITADQNKGYGMSDGMLFMGDPIKNIS